MKPKQVVLDTNVCLDLFVFKDPRWSAILNGLQKGQIIAVTRDDCRQEWLAVLHYEHLPVNDDTRAQFVDAFDEVIICIAPDEKNFILPRCSDKDDQKFLEIARDAEVETLITKDKALLKLARKIRQAGYYNIETPESFLKSLCQTVL